MQHNGVPSFSPLTQETYHILIYHLTHSISPHAQEREAALAWLQACQAAPGFQSSLINVVANREQPNEVRTQAVLYFKNCLPKYWKNVGTTAIDPQSRQQIRSKLLSLLDEKDSAIAKTLAYCVGRIARKDFPRDWPDLFDNLIGTMTQACESMKHGNDQARLVLHRALLYFQQSVKALSENRTLAGKNIMGGLCEQAFEGLTQLYKHLFQSSLHHIAANQNALPSIPEGGAPTDLELSLLTLKIISKLLVYGWGGTGLNPQRKEEFITMQKSFFTSSIQNFQTIYQARLAILSNPNNAASLKQQAQLKFSPLICLNKHTLAYGKMYQALMFQNHMTFHGIGQTKELVQLYWTFIQEAGRNIRNLDLDDPASPFPLSFIMQYLLFIKYCFLQFPYKDPTLVDEAFATGLTECIVLHLLPLRQPDLDKWQEDPEEFIKDEEEEKWRFDVRPCAQAMLKELMREYSHVVLQVNEYRMRYQHAASFEDLLVKEAIYTAIGDCPSEFSSAQRPDGSPILAYPEWLANSLAPEANSTDPAGLIIRRRIAPIASSFMPEIASNVDAQSLAYQVIVHLLQQNGSTDLAVRMTAAKALANSESWQIDLDPLLPYLETAFIQLADILQQVELPESKMQLNEILGNLIIRADSKVEPHLERLLNIIMQLWSSAQDDPSKQAVVATFKKLVDALKTGSTVLHTGIRELVQSSCDPSSPSHVFLQDDGLELWRAALRFTASPTDDLMALAPLSIQLLSEGSDILPKVLRIIQSYILLQPEPYLAQFAQAILTNVAHLLETLSNEATKPLLYTIDMVVQAAPANVWAPAMLNSGLFLQITKTIATDPAASSITRSLPTLARLAISDGSAFNELLRQSAPHVGMPYEELSMAVLRKWLDRYDNLTYPAQRKLVALGLASFVQTTNHVVLDHIDEIIGAWLSALGETEENDTGECVEQSCGDQDVPSKPWQQQQHTPPSSLPMTNPLGSSNGSARQESGSPTVSLSSRADPSSSFYSEASSSRSSSLDTAQTSVPPSPWDQMSADDTIVHHSTKQHRPGDDCGNAAAVAQSDFWSRDTSGHPGAGNASDLWSTHADSQNPFSSSSITSPHSSDSDATPSLPQHSTFSHWQFVDFDPNSVNSTRAGHDDDGDHLFGPSYLDNSADCYYNTDEHDEEAILDNAWAGTGDGWGVQHETPIPEDQRLRALIARDPLHTLKLATIISNSLNYTAELNGGMQVFHANYLAPPKVAPIVLEEFQQWLTGVAHGGD